MNLRSAAVQAREALDLVTTSETFYRDPRGDRAGPAIDALDAALSQEETAPQPVAAAVVRVQKVGGNPGIAWRAEPLDSAPLMRDGELLYVAASPVQVEPRDAMDAKRYRWLRNEVKFCATPGRGALVELNGYSFDTPELVDAAIDADMQKE